MSLFIREFAFKPKESVKIIAYGLHYDGLIIRCIWEQGDEMYDVEYNADGEIRRREFYKEQLRK